MRLFHSAAAAVLFGVFAATANAATPADPAVVELFTSQGCSSCPPANANLIALAGRPDVLALTFDVTYWDSLGWKDTFGQPSYTERQSDYERPLGESGAFTPQVVVDGRADTVGNVKSAIEQLIAKSNRSGGPALAFDGGKVSVGAGSGGAADVWLVRYDPRIVQVAIARGENSGTTQSQTHVVRALTRLGKWNGSAARFALTPEPQGLKTAVLVQRENGGPIVAALRN